jgi:hypothetical protein
VRIDSIEQRVIYWARTWGCSAKSTFLNALKRKWITCPGINYEQAAKYYPNLPENALGHLTHTRKGQHSTKLVPNKRAAYCKIVNYTDLDPDIIQSRRMFGDMMGGKFPLLGLNKVSQVLVVYDEVENYVCFRAVDGKNHVAQTTAYQKCLDLFKSKGIIITDLVIDNDRSEYLEKWFATAGIKTHIVPPDNHGINKAERMIQTGRNLLISMMCATNPNAPTFLIFEYLEQAEIIINSLRASNSNPEISAYHHVHGQPFNIWNHPMAPVGTLVIVYVSKAKRAQSFGTKGLAAFYLGPQLSGYRSYRVWIPSTKKIRHTDTLAWFPHNFQMPYAKPEELILQRIHDLTEAVQTLHVPKVEHQKTVMELTSSISAQLISLAAMFAPPQPVDTEDKNTINAVLHPYTRLYGEMKHDVPPGSSRMHVENNQVSGVNWNPLNVPRTLNEWNPHAIRTETAQKASIERVLTPTSTTDTTPKHVTLPTSAERVQAIIKQATPNTTTISNLKIRSGDHPTLPQTLREAISKSRPDREIWIQALHTELLRLLNTGTIVPIKPNSTLKYPAGFLHTVTAQKVTESGELRARIRAVYNPRKDDIYDGPTAARVANMELVKIHLNHVCSTPNATYSTCDLENFYLGSVLPTPGYMRIHRKQLPQSIIDAYNLEKLFYKDEILMEVQRALYGMKQAGYIAQQDLFKLLRDHDYFNTDDVPCLWLHRTNTDLSFTLTVDDFGICSIHEASKEHLLNTLRNKYSLSVGNGNQYIGLTLDWDYVTRTVDLSIPGYVAEMIKKFQFVITKGAKTPYLPYESFTRGKRNQKQLANNDDSSPECSPSDKLFIQRVTGCMLYLGRAVDDSVATAINIISSNGFTERAHQMTVRLLQYISKYPEPHLRFHGSNMQLSIATDASFQTVSRGRSRWGGCMHLGTNLPPSIHQGNILVKSSVIKVVVASVGEAEYAGVCKGGQNAVPLRVTLDILGHTQGPTPIRIDNTFAENLIKGTIKERMSKSIDRDFHWIRDRVRKGEFHIEHVPGIENPADFFTKTLPVGPFQKRQFQLVHYPHSKSSTPETANNALSVTGKIQLDSAASKNFVCLEDKKFLSNIIASNRQMEIETANGHIVQSQTEGNLFMPELPTAATKAHIVPAFTSSLMSVASIVDADPTIEITFNTKEAKIYQRGVQIMRGLRDSLNRLWYLPLQIPTN